MKELKDIVAAYDIAVKQGKKAALATVVQVEGSAYRRAGARMLITEDGQLTGAISGGCLEGDALRKARLVIMQQEPMLVTYDTLDDDDAKLGVGLGCNGIIHILIEPVTNSPLNPIELIKAFIYKRLPAVLVTLFNVEERKATQPGTCMCLSDDNLWVSMADDSECRLKLINDVREVMMNQQSQTKTAYHHTTYTAFIEYLKPSISLIIAGAGNDAVPLVKMAAVMGWDVTVVDGRPGYAVTARFSSAKSVITAKPEQVLQHVTTDEWTAFVLMTHNYNYEIALLEQLLPLPLSYIGILGPKKKLERMLGELRDNGQRITDEQLSNIYGPVGLDIGADAAEEIALSIIAEVKAVLSARKGYSLKFRPSPIHSARLQPVSNK
jgi:xanthine dehydrogenase accessory factor